MAKTDPSIIYRDLTPEEIEERSIYEAETYQREYEYVAGVRRQLYTEQADPIYFQAQRGDTYTLEDWKAKIAEIDAANPYPERPENG